MFVDTLYGVYTNNLHVCIHTSTFVYKHTTIIQLFVYKPHGVYTNGLSTNIRVVCIQTNVCVYTHFVVCIQTILRVYNLNCSLSMDEIACLQTEQCVYTCSLVCLHTSVLFVDTQYLVCIQTSAFVYKQLLSVYKHVIFSSGLYMYEMVCLQTVCLQTF